MISVSRPCWERSRGTGDDDAEQWGGGPHVRQGLLRWQPEVRHVRPIHHCGDEGRCTLIINAKTMIWCFVSGWGQVQNCSWQRVPWCSGRKESIYKLSWSPCRKEFTLIIYLYHLFFHHYHRYMFSIFTHNKSYNKIYMTRCL